MYGYPRIYHRFVIDILHFLICITSYTSEKPLIKKNWSDSMVTEIPQPIKRTFHHVICLKAMLKSRTTGMTTTTFMVFSANKSFYHLYFFRVPEWMKVVSSCFCWNLLRFIILLLNNTVFYLYVLINTLIVTNKTYDLMKIIHLDFTLKFCLLRYNFPAF